MSDGRKSKSVEFDDTEDFNDEMGRKQIKELTRKITLAKRDQERLIQQNNNDKERVTSSQFKKIIETITNEKTKNGHLLGFLEASRDQYSMLETYHKALETEVETLNKRYLDMSLTNIELANQLKNLQEEKQSVEVLIEENKKLDSMIETATKPQDKGKRGTSRNITQGLRRESRPKQQRMSNPRDTAKINTRNPSKTLVKSPVEKPTTDLPNDKSPAPKNSSNINSRNTRKTMVKSSGNSVIDTQNGRKRVPLITSPGNDDTTEAPGNDRTSRITGRNRLTLQKRHNTDNKTVDNKENRQSLILKNSEIIGSDNKALQQKKEDIINKTTENIKGDKSDRSKSYKPPRDIRDKKVERSKVETQKAKQNKRYPENNENNENTRIQNTDQREKSERTPVRTMINGDRKNKSERTPVIKVIDDDRKEKVKEITRSKKSMKDDNKQTNHTPVSNVTNHKEKVKEVSGSNKDINGTSKHSEHTPVSNVTSGNRKEKMKEVSSSNKDIKGTSKQSEHTPMSKTTNEDYKSHSNKSKSDKPPVYLMRKSIPKRTQPN